MTTQRDVRPLHPHGVPVASIQGTLALDLSPRLAPPRIGHGDPDPGHDPSADVVSIQHGRRVRFEAWAGRFGQAAVEIAAGDRPAAQLRRWTTPEVYADLARRSQLMARAAGQTGPGAGRGRGFVRPLVAGVHTGFVAPDVCEVSFRVRHGSRSRAVAARFEHAQGHWLCTALEFA